MARKRPYATLTASDLHDMQSMDQLESPAKKEAEHVLSSCNPGGYVDTLAVVFDYAEFA
jgi:hypothetical protein